MDKRTIDVLDKVIIKFVDYEIPAIVLHVPQDVGDMWHFRGRREYANRMFAVNPLSSQLIMIELEL